MPTSAFSRRTDRLITVEDPFSYLSALVPDPLTRPQLLPIYPPPPPPAYPPPTPRDTPTTPAPPGHSYPLPTLVSPSPLHPAPARAPPPATKHWTVLRSGGPRRAKDDSAAPADDADDHAREAHALDFGSFAVLAGELAEEMRRRGVPLPEGLEDADGVLKGAVRDSLELAAGDGAEGGGDGGSGAGAEPPVFDAKEYWSTRHAVDAEGYIRDVVYGGVDGLAYVRSLAELVATPPLDVGDRAPDEEAEEDVDMDSTPTLPLGTTLASWVAQNVVGPLTEGRHALLQRTARELIAPTPAPKPENGLGNLHPDDDKLPALVSAALHVHPRAAAALAALLQIHSQKIDMAALVRAPADLAQSEEEWAGKGAAATSNGPAEMNAVLDYVAGVICRLQAERERDGSVKQEVADVPVNEEGAGESAVMRNLRLNLLALVKRAPVDTLAIAQLPVGLLPEQVWQYMPMMNGVTGNPQA